MLSNDEILAALQQLRINGPTIPLINIPKDLRNEYLSSRDFSLYKFPDVQGELAVSATVFAAWVGLRLRPDYEHPEVMRDFSKQDLHTLQVLKTPLFVKEVTAYFKAGAHIIELMKDEQVYASVAFGYLRDQSFEQRYTDWICTSLIVGIWEREDAHWIYTKSGSIYHADKPLKRVQLPLDQLHLLRKGLSPSHFKVIEQIEAEGHRLTNMISD